MLGTLDEDAGDVGNFRSYVARGSYHTIMRSPAFYAEASAEVPYADWVRAMLKGKGGPGGGGKGKWKDAACPTCLAALPCS